MSQNIIQQKTFAFARKIFQLHRVLIEEKEFVLAKQIIRSGTSIGANVEEGIVAHGRKDFLYKLNISLKEAHETRYWLLLLQSEQVAAIDFNLYLDDINEIIKILSSITTTVRNSLKD